MLIELSTLETAEVYATLTQTIVPRPVAWLLSENDDGGLNLAPFSYFSPICSSPPTVMISVGVPVNGGLKDTRYNLEQRPNCVIHIAHSAMAAQVTASSATMDRNVSEVSELGLSTVDMPGSPVPRLGQCRIAYAAKLSDANLIHGQWVAFLELSSLYLADDIVGVDDKGRRKILADQLNPIARLGGGEYFIAGDILNIDRPA